MTTDRQLATVATALADAFLAGAWTRGALIDRGAGVVSGRQRWLGSLVTSVLQAYRDAPVDRPRELAAFIAVCGPLPDAFSRAREDGGPVPQVLRRRVAPTAMGRTRWPVRRLDTVADVAGWLGLSAAELDWLADRRSLERRVPDERLRHYRYRWLPKPDGGVRLLEAPKELLKERQRRLLRDVLGHIPAHPAAYGFVPGRSAVSHAAAHAGRPVVVRLDLESFFAGVSAGRVFGILRTAGYPQPVAHTLTGLTTNVVPREVWRRSPWPAHPALLDRHARLGLRLATPHLPQGAPTSPALANLAAYRLDRRLGGLAETFEATYTRYADDLTFSGDRRLLPAMRTLLRAAEDIAGGEGFRLNESKTRVRTSAQRQRVAGLVVNVAPNVARAEYDRLKAVLHDAARHGPEAANRSGQPEFRAHVLGRIAWIAAVNPARGARLRAALSRIEWDAAPLASRES